MISPVRQPVRIDFLKFLSRTLRQPLLHFLVLGALIFAFYDYVAPATVDVDAEPGEDLVVTTLQLDRLNAEFEAIWQRPPTAEEQQKLIDNYIREEVLVREALRLGLDRDDTVLRRRLVQKMDYLAASAARARKPTEDELVAHYDANRESYLRPGRVAFEQIFLGETADEMLIGEIRTQLDDGVPAIELGKRTLLPSSLGLSARAKVNGLFGEGVFEKLMELDEGSWEGPIRSGYGYHLVQVTEGQQPEQLSLEEARKFVTEDWSLEKFNQAKEDQHQVLKSQYRITVQEAAE